MRKLTNIVKSRFIKGESLPQWYEDRLLICSMCELNSNNIDNKDKSSLRKGWEFIAGAHCTHPKCGCTISEKSKIEEESCPIDKWGSVESNKLTSQSHTVENKTPDKAKLGKEGIYYYLDLGSMEYGENKEVLLSLNLDNAKNIKASGSCGCLTVNTKTEENITELTIKYNTSLVGKIQGKTVRVDYIKNGINNQITFLVRGSVTK